MIKNSYNFDNIDLIKKKYSIIIKFKFKIFHTLHLKMITTTNQNFINSIDDMSVI